MHLHHEMETGKQRIQSEDSRLVKGTNSSTGKNYKPAGSRVDNPHLKWAFSKGIMLLKRESPCGKCGGIFHAISKPRFYACFWTVYSCGLRLHEALALQIGDNHAKLSIWLNVAERHLLIGTFELWRLVSRSRQTSGFRLWSHKSGDFS